MAASTLKGFVRIKARINNTPGVISPIGELSTYSKTFTTDLKEYEDSRWPDLTLSAFQSLDSEGKEINAQATHYESVLRVSNHIYTFCRTFTGTPTKLDILNSVNTEFFGQLQSLYIGELVTNNALTLPESLGWSIVGIPANDIKVWYSDPAFADQYPEYKIVVVPPIDNLDDFFKTVPEIKAAIAARTGAKTGELVTEAKSRHPSTIDRVSDFELVLQANPEYKPTLSWTTVIYGTAGDTIDNIKQALRDYCLANSSYGVADWAKIFPDIFKTTEFLIVPRWDKVAIPNKTTQKGANSPVVSPVETLVVVKAMFPTIAAAHIEAHLQVLTHPFMSVSLAVFGGTENRASLFKITDYFPDYICVGTNSPDFNRMEKFTQDWSYMMNNLLRIAEDPDNITHLPISIRKITRGGMQYVGQTMGNVLYLVATKANFSF